MNQFKLCLKVTQWYIIEKVWAIKFSIDDNYCNFLQNTGTDSYKFFCFHVRAHKLIYHKAPPLDTLAMAQA